MPELAIDLSGSEGNFMYRFPSGLPAGRRYPLPEGNFVGRVDWLEYLAFWAMNDQELPTSVDVLDVTFVDADGVIHPAEASFRAEALANRITMQSAGNTDLKAVKGNFDAIGVQPVISIGFGFDKNGYIIEQLETDPPLDIQPGRRMLWTIFGHVRRDAPKYGANAGGVEAWADFASEAVAADMARRLARIFDIRY
jgi:hypothetical protein